MYGQQALCCYWADTDAWIELTLARPSRVNRIALFHQLNPGHYRSLDYTVQVRKDGGWEEVAEVKNNQLSGWVSHPFDAVVTNAVRLQITRSAFGNRMGIGEIELRLATGVHEPD